MAEKIELTFLGTSAGIPTSKRNHCANLIKYKEESILVDCGEGTQRQFRYARMNPCKITRILITHVHGDHILGLFGLISTLNSSEYSGDLFIYGPKGSKRFLENFLDIKLNRNFKLVIKEVSGKFFETEEFYLEAEKMEHTTPTNAYSFVVKDKLRIDKVKLKKSGIKEGRALKKISLGEDVVIGNKKIKAKTLTYIEKGKKVSFVLDTVYNKRIVPFVKNSDLFVCEGSFGEDLKTSAKEKLHLTVSQAGKIAKDSKSKKLILTHISQRYEKNLKSLLEEAKKSFKSVSIAKDLDRIVI